MQPNRVLLVWALLLTALLLMGFTLPGGPFVSGDVISAAEMNAKFQAVENELADLRSDLGKLASQVAPRPTLYTLQTDLNVTYQSATQPWRKLSDLLTFTKARADSRIVGRSTVSLDLGLENGEHRCPCREEHTRAA